MYTCPSVCICTYIYLQVYNVHMYIFTSLYMCICAYIQMQTNMVAAPCVGVRALTGSFFIGWVRNVYQIALSLPVVSGKRSIFFRASGLATVL